MNRLQAQPYVEPVETADDCILAVHGGAGVLSRELLGNGGNAGECREALESGLAGWLCRIEKSRCAASIDAVLAAVRSLEDSPCFNAGKGAAFTRDGRNELDAAVMDGDRAAPGPWPA